MSQSKTQGLSLIEIIIAIAILSIAMLAMAGMQSASFKSTRTARQTQEAVAVVRAEIEQLRAAPATVGDQCHNKTVKGYQFECKPTPCTIKTDVTLECTPYTPAAQRRAWEIELRVKFQDKPLLTTTTIIAE